MMTVFGVSMFLLTQSRGGYLALGLTGLTLVAGWLGLVAIWVLSRYRIARFWTGIRAGGRMDEEAHHR